MREWAGWKERGRTASDGAQSLGDGQQRERVGGKELGKNWPSPNSRQLGFVCLA